MVFDKPNAPQKTLRPRKPATNPVTIIIGLKYREGPEADGIVIASDSQTTWTDTNAKRLDINKISTVTFSDGTEAIVAQAGSATAGGRLIEMFREAASKEFCTDSWSVAKAAEKAIRQLRDLMRIQQMDCSSEELRTYIENEGMNCALLIAHYFKDKPYLYKVDLLHGIACQEATDFCATGSGSAVAHLLLGGMDFNRSRLDAISTAVYVIEKVKQADATCGGLTRLATVTRKKDQKVTVTPYDQGAIQGTANTVAQCENESREAWNKRIREIIDKLRQEWIRATGEK